MVKFNVARRAFKLSRSCTFAEIRQIPDSVGVNDVLLWHVEDAEKVVI
jgi:hypothetical protein